MEKQTETPLEIIRRGCRAEMPFAEVDALVFSAYPAMTVNELAELWRAEGERQLEEANALQRFGRERKLRNGASRRLRP